MGSPRECTRILGLEGFRVETIEWDADEPPHSARIRIKRPPWNGVCTTRIPASPSCARTGALHFVSHHRSTRDDRPATRHLRWSTCA